MSQVPNIRTVSGEKFIRITESDLAICGGKDVAAALLNYFIGWHTRAIRICQEGQEPELWRPHSNSFIAGNLKNIYSIPTLRKWIKHLVDNDLVLKETRKHNLHGSITYYRLNYHLVNKLKDEYQTTIENEHNSLGKNLHSQQEIEQSRGKKVSVEGERSLHNKNNTNNKNTYIHNNESNNQTKQDSSMYVNNSDSLDSKVKDNDKRLKALELENQFLKNKLNQEELEPTDEIIDTLLNQEDNQKLDNQEIQELLKQDSAGNISEAAKNQMMQNNLGIGNQSEDKVSKLINQFPKTFSRLKLLITDVLPNITDASKISWYEACFDGLRNASQVEVDHINQVIEDKIANPRLNEKNVNHWKHFNLVLSDPRPYDQRQTQSIQQNTSQEPVEKYPDRSEVFQEKNFTKIIFKNDHYPFKKGDTLIFEETRRGWLTASDDSNVIHDIPHKHVEPIFDGTAREF